MTDQELKDLVAGLAVSQAETARELKEIAREADRRQQETARELKEISREADRRQQEADRRQQKADRRQQALRQEIGGLANKFGDFTEGLALPSMEKLLTERFGMECIAPNIRKRRNGRSLQIDVMAYANTETNAVYLVEVKSRLRDGSIEQMIRILDSFFEFFPEHRGKELYGILAAVDAPENLRIRAHRKGLYLARISGDVFELQVPDDFKAHCFSPADT